MSIRDTTKHHEENAHLKNEDAELLLDKADNAFAEENWDIVPDTLIKAVGWYLNVIYVLFPVKDCSIVWQHSCNFYTLHFRRKRESGEREFGNTALNIV